MGIGWKLDTDEVRSEQMTRMMILHIRSGDLALPGALEIKSRGLSHLPYLTLDVWKILYL